MYDLVTGYMEAFHRWALRFSDAVICNSEAGLRHVTRGLVDVSRFHLVENGIDSERFCFTDLGRRKLRTHWAVTANRPLIGLVGRHDPIKDHALFVSAAAITTSQFPNARFVIVGNEASTTTSDLKMQAEILGISQHLIWAGERADMSAVYSALDVLCLCSHSEGFPNVVAEAMSCGLPCVTTDVGDVRRLIGNAGWVVNGRKPTDLAEAINEAIAG
jgi:glycosyltransferase involved in cell wall biosynthesis